MTLLSLNIICGHAGVGKTNFALNLAVAAPACSTIVDLDVVNPYFRTSDNAAFLNEHNVKMLGPVFGGSSGDAPSLMPGINTAIQEATRDCPVIVDVGGDPDGAKALARFKPDVLKQEDRQVIYVVNFRRPETATVDDNIMMMRMIEGVSGVSVTSIFSNTNLGASTDEAIVAEGDKLAAELADATGLPLFDFDVRRIVKTIWE
ncbi:MAG: hypothetical protein LBM21_00135 [Coriobacteriales bacterium]|jgi:hypothetical protein|nr:hypothetical protein [Coriobacteriales bacterium]